MRREVLRERIQWKDLIDGELHSDLTLLMEEHRDLTLLTGRITLIEPDRRDGYSEEIILIEERYGVEFQRREEDSGREILRTEAGP